MDISWKHLEKLYIKNRAQGLSLVPKIKYEHVYLTSFSKMRVDLAAQVRIERQVCIYLIQTTLCIYTFRCLAILWQRL